MNYVEQIKFAPKTKKMNYSIIIEQKSTNKLKTICSNDGAHQEDA